MRTDKPGKHYAKIILHRGNEPVFIPLDVENNPVLGQKTGIPINRLDICRTLPVRMLNVMVPCL
jgi:hypothetical protein